MADPLIVAKPTKPVSEMTDAELDDFAEAVVEAMKQAHDAKKAGTKPSK